MSFLTAAFLITTQLILQDAPADGYILDPYQLNPSLDRHSEWLKSFERTISFASFLGTAKNPELGKVNEILNRGSQAALELDFDLAEEQADEAIAIISKMTPHARLKSDYLKAVALKALASANKNDDSSFPMLALPLLDRKEFISELPLKLQNRAEMMKIKQCALPSSQNFTGRIFSLDREISSNQKIKEGKILSYRIAEHNLEARWLSCVNDTATSELLWKRPLWTLLPSATLASTVRKTKPAALPEASVWVLLPSGSGETQRVLVVSRKSGANPPPLQEMPDKDWIDEEPSSDWPILKNPWFWVGVGVVAGLGGWGIYELTKGNETRVVTTP